MHNGRRMALITFTFALALASCGERVDPTLQPDALLRDSLGLGDGDRIHTVLVSGASNQERAEPGTVEARSGDLVQFVTGDRRPHTIAFLLDSLPDAASSYLREKGQAASPPLVDVDSRFIVTLEGAPAGRYPFVVEGTGAPVRGAVVVSAADRPR